MNSVLEEATALAGRMVLGVAGRTMPPRLTILIFHRVLREPDPLFPAELHAARFERLMRTVSRLFQVIPLDQAVHQLGVGSLPSRAVAISFDDGYADNHDVALPILRQLGLSATVFVSTGFLDGGRMWNDSVIECVRRTTMPNLDISEFGFGRLPAVTAEDRRRVIDLLLPVLKYRSPVEREQMLRRVHQLTGNPELPRDFMMSKEQVRALHRAGMGVGAHTVRHPILCTLSEAEAQAELVESREQLQSMLDAPVPLFAYPNGRPGKDYDERHVKMARAAGFTAAVSTQPGVARTGVDLFQLPRYTPWDVSNVRWAARLAMHHVRS